MTQEWLSDVHEMQMLKLLWIAICRQMAIIKIEIEGPYFYGYLKSVFKAGELKYKNLVLFSHVCSLGEALQSGQHTSIGFIMNVNSNHWVSTVVDFIGCHILYGNSLGQAPENEPISIIQWWAQYHTGTQFTVTKLPIPLQQDSFSCGILVFGTLIHFSLPSQYPLMNVQLVDEERMKVF